MVRRILSCKYGIMTWFVIVLLLFEGCGKNAKKEKQNNIGRYIPKPKVTVLKVKPKDVSFTLSSVGSLEADEVHIYSKINGAITKLRFREGDFVLKNKTVLVEIDPQTYFLEMQKARTQVKIAHIQLKIALIRKKKILAEYKKIRTTYRRRKELFKKNIVTAEELLTYKTLNTQAKVAVDEIHASIEEAIASIQHAKILYKLARQNFTDSKIKSPISGIVQAKFVSIGDYVRPGTLIATLVDESAMRVKFSIPQSQASRIFIGQKIKFSLPALPDKIFSAVIYYISQSANQQTRSVEVRADRISQLFPDDFEKQKGINNNLNEKAITLLKPGYFVNIELQTAIHKNAILLPAQAVLPTEKGFIVYTLENGIAKGKKVEIGLYTNDGDIEILSGIGPGDTIIVQGANIVKDGMEVDISS
ncbi:MAG: efflux RND transporter periplasmic adaptor subunit [Planctomycetota bacterium]